MKNMFHGCNSLTSLDVSNWDTSNVTTMGAMFNSCTSLTKLDMKNWKINKESELASMFSKCSSLIKLDLSSWENLPFMIYGMFYGCKKLTTLNLNNICINEEPFMTNCFYGCESLNNITMQNSDYSSVNKIITELPDRRSSDPGILNITVVDDASQVNTATAQSKYWNIA
jgi:surface protein